MKYISIIIVLFFTISCNKEVDDSSLNFITINEMSLEKEQDLRDLVKMRLALAKVVSIAFNDDEFRSYFKMNFGTKSKNGNYFEECLLLKHADDKVLKNGTTLKTFLNDINDKEVNGIFGKNFIEHILTYDNRVCLKLPDMFLEYNWDINKTIPMVFGTYPARYIEDSYLGYHLGNKTQKFVVRETPQVFHVNIKPTEDYILLDKITLVDEFSNDLLMYIPQIQTCSDVWNDIFNSSLSINSFFIINLKFAFQQWQKKCGYKGGYINTDGCTEPCQRNCVEPPPHIYVLDHFKALKFLDFTAEIEAFFRETFTMHAQFKDLRHGINYTDLAVPAIRLSELGFRYSISGGVKGREDIPYISISNPTNPTKSEIVDVKYLITEIPNSVIQYTFTTLYYGDLYYRVKSLSGIPFPYTINAERMLNVGSSVLFDCDDAETSFESGAFSWVFRY